MLILITALTASIFTAVYAYQIPEEEIIQGIRYSYSHSGKYNYNATLVPNILYNTSILVNPDKAFLKLVKEISLNYEYSFSSPSLTKANGTLVVRLVVGQGELWKKVIVNKVKTFNGNTVNYGLKINVSKVAAYARNISSEIGISGSKYFIQIDTEARIDAVVSGEHIRETFPTSFTIDTDFISNIVSFSDREFSKDQEVKYSVREPTYVVLGSLSIPTSQFKLISVIPLIATSSLLAAVVFINRDKVFGGGLPEVKRIERKYGGLIVNILSGGKEGFREVVKVADFSDLAKIADSLAKPIIHTVVSDSRERHIYYVIDGDVRYEYVVGNEEG